MKKKTRINQRRKRTILNRYIDSSWRFEGTFERFGKSSISGHGLPKKTMLITNLKVFDGGSKKDKGHVICDHIWINSDEVINLNRLKGCKRIHKIKFEGTPYRYYPFKFGKVEAKYSIGDVVITDFSELQD